MTWVRRLAEIRIADRGVAGDKAASLGELIHAGFDVPPGLVVTPDAYRTVLAANGMAARISDRLAATEIDDPVDLEDAAEEIRSWIKNAPLGLTLVEEITASLQELAGQCPAPPRTGYAVRVSRLVEDVVNPRASGLAQAFLGVFGDEAILNHVRQGWATLWTSRAIYYRHRKKMDQKQIALAVIIQPMVEADAAGVMFTRNPMTFAEDEIHINATWGLGEAILAARWTSDHIVVRKNDLSILQKEIADKNMMEIVTPDGGLETVVVPPERQRTCCIEDEHVLGLAEIARRAETHFKQAQDIEWCRAGNQLLLLQTRPLKVAN